MPVCTLAVISCTDLVRKGFKTSKVHGKGNAWVAQEFLLVDFIYNIQSIWYTE